MANSAPRLIVKEGVTYLYDQQRAKVLSVTRAYMRAGIHSRTVSNQYLRVEDGQPTMSVGDTLPRNATIIGLTANCETASSWSLEIHRRGSTGPLAALSLVNSSSAIINSLDVDVAAGDVLLFKLNGINVPFPRGMLEIAWRL